MVIADDITMYNILQKRMRFTRRAGVSRTFDAVPLVPDAFEHHDMT